jgi:CheY-like chemotaxis protein
MPPLKKKVIIVEDEPDTAEMFSEMIRLSGFQVLKAYGGAPAINLIAAQKPDAVILDIVMPDISGLEVLRFIRCSPQLENIPVIVVSGKSLPSDIRSGLEAGATEYLTKPVAYLDLKEAVENAVRSKVETGYKNE